MARYTSVYKSFLDRLDEVEILRKAAAKKEKQSPITLRKEINALCRGAIVLLCGHLEAYVKELGEVALDSLYDTQAPRALISSRLYYHISKDILDEIRSSTDGAMIAEKMFTFIESDMPFWSRSGPFPKPISAEKFNKGFSNPGFKKIRSYFNRFGYQQYGSDLASLLKTQYVPTINMVDHVVDIRNKVAHGDNAATKTPSEVKDMIKLVRVYCMSTDRVFASWCGKNICKIR